MTSGSVSYIANPLERLFSGLVLLALLTACGTSGPPENVAPLVVRALLAAGRDSQFVDIGRRRWNRLLCHLWCRSRRLQSS